MPEQPQWSERTLDMPPQDPWADAPTTPEQPVTGYPPPGSTGPPTRPDAYSGERTRADGPQTRPDGYSQTRPDSFAAPLTGADGPASAPAQAPAPPASADLPFSAGRASVRPHPRSQPFAAEHEPTGTGWPGADVPYTRPTMRELRRGGEWTTAALLWAFVCWGIWALSNDGVWSTKIIIFVISVIVAGGLFALSRLVGRIVLEKQFHRVRRSARGSHAVASLFLAGVGLAHLQQTDWVMNALSWVIKTVS
jgi:hypothetical protein